MRVRTKRDSASSEALTGQRFNRLGLGLGGVFALAAGVELPFLEYARAPPAAPDPTITVRVYDYTQAPRIILARAEVEAGRIFGEAGLKVLWLDCTIGPNPIPQDPCQKPIEAVDIRLRILLAPVRNFL